MAAEAWEEQCKDVFASFDLDGNGRITPYIIGQVMKKYGWTVQPYELVKMISDVDDDDNGYITVEEFIPLMTQVIHEDKYLEEEIFELFVHFGKERSFLSSEALASKLLIASNGALSSDDIKEKLLQFQDPKDGPYDYRNAARIIYENILDKSGRRLNHDTSQSVRQKKTVSKVAMMLGIKYRNKKLDP